MPSEWSVIYISVGIVGIINAGSDVTFADGKAVTAEIPV